MNSNTNVVIDEMLRSIQYMIDKSMSKSTQCYDGLVVSNAGNGKWNIMYNGETHAIKGYGLATPSINTVVKVIIPQGNQALAWFFVPIDGTGGTGDGIYYTPFVSDNGIISWTNNGGLPNPNSVDIMGPEGPAGEDGADGIKGDTGPYFTPSVSSSGDLSWTNNGGLTNPTTVNIKGPQGDIGPTGPQGEQGIQGEPGEQGTQGIQGETGPYYIPNVDNIGNLSWTNTGNLQNPETVNIRGPQGLQGEQGIQGIQGPAGTNGADGVNGATFTPTVSDTGDLSWTNDKGLDNPATVNIMGPQGPQGEPGQDGAQGPQGPEGPQGATGPSGADGKDGIGATIQIGTVTTGAAGTQATVTNTGTENAAVFNFTIPQGIAGQNGADGAPGAQGPAGPAGTNGADATINGVNALTITTSQGITGTQSGSTYNIGIGNSITIGNMVLSYDAATNSLYFQTA